MTRIYLPEILILGLAWKLQPKFFNLDNPHSLHEFSTTGLGFLDQNSGSEYAVRSRLGCGRSALEIGRKLTRTIRAG